MVNCYFSSHPNLFTSERLLSVVEKNTLNGRFNRIKMKRKALFYSFIFRLQQSVPKALHHLSAEAG